MFVISLTGGSGSGKTSIVQVLFQLIDNKQIAWLPMDAYYKDHSHLNDSEKKLCNFDHPDAMDFDLLCTHLMQLKSGVPVLRPVYSYLSCSRLPEVIDIKPTDILIVDGLFPLMEPRIMLNTNLKIFLDVSEENRLRRILERDASERGRSHEMIVNRFFETVAPMHSVFVEPGKKYADIVIDANLLQPEEIALKIFSIIKTMHWNKFKTFEI